MPPQRLRLALPHVVSPRSGSTCRRWRIAAAVGAILFVAWTQVFLGIHELSHLGQTDTSGCRFAQVASTCAGGTTAAAAVFQAPAVRAAAYLYVPTPPSSAVSIPQHARAPPALA